MVKYLYNSIYLYIAWQVVRNNIFDFSFFHGLQQKLTWLFRPPTPPTPTSRRPETRFNSPRDGRKQGGVRGVVGGSRTESTEVGGFGVGKSWCEMEQGWHLRWRFCLQSWVMDIGWLVVGGCEGVPKWEHVCMVLDGFLVGFYIQYWTCGSMLEEMMASGPFGFKEIVEEMAFLYVFFEIDIFLLWSSSPCWPTIRKDSSFTTCRRAPVHRVKIMNSLTSIRIIRISHVGKLQTWSCL